MKKLPVILTFTLISLSIVILATFVSKSVKERRAERELNELRKNIWPQEKRLTEERVKAKQLTNETINALTVNLKPYINAALTESPASPKAITNNNLAELPKGTHIYAGVPFDVQGLIQLSSKGLVKFGKTYPREVTNIAINATCSKIHMFHGANWVDPRKFGAKAASIILHYEDGAAQRFDLVTGDQVFDFWYPLFQTGMNPRFQQKAPGTELAWTGLNPYIRRLAPDCSLNLYRTTFANPQASKRVASLDYVATSTETAPFLAGLTIE